MAPFAHRLLLSAYRILGGITSLGAENIPATGPVILCPNHLSDSDAAALYATSPRRDIHFVARHELFCVPILGAFFRGFGGLPIRRDSSDRQSIERAIQIVSSGCALVIFPEGRLSQTGALQRVQPGAALIAIKSQAPVVPVGLHRTNWFLPYGDVVPIPSRLPARVVFGEPIWTQDCEHLKGRKAVDAVTEELERRLRRLTEQ